MTEPERVELLAQLERELYPTVAQALRELYAAPSRKPRRGVTSDPRRRRAAHQTGGKA